MAVDKSRFRKIVFFNVAVFFVGWIAIFLAGADKPPPVGFLWLVLLIALLDVILYLYLRRFIPDLVNRRTGLFFKNLMFFALGGVAVGTLTTLGNLNQPPYTELADTVIWISVVTAVATLCGICFYVVNVGLIRWSQHRQDSSLTD